MFKHGFPKKVNFYANHLMSAGIKFKQKKKEMKRYKNDIQTHPYTLSKLAEYEKMYLLCVVLNVYTY